MSEELMVKEGQHVYGITKINNCGIPGSDDGGKAEKEKDVKLNKERIVDRNTLEHLLAIVIDEDGCFYNPPSDFHQAPIEVVSINPTLRKIPFITRDTLKELLPAPIVIARFDRSTNTIYHKLFWMDDDEEIKNECPEQSNPIDWSKLYVTGKYVMDSDGLDIGGITNVILKG